MLREIIENNHFNFVDECSDWKDAIKKGCVPLIKDNTIDDRYPEAIIESIDKYGPYIVLLPGLAMPHSTMGSPGVNETSISFMKVNKPVYFDEQHYANIFFTLCATNNEKHIKNIQELSNILQDENLINELMNVNNQEDLINIVNKYEPQDFEFNKIHLDDITRCYCTSHMMVDDTPYAFFASEDPNSECYAYYGDNFENKEIVWTGDRGGCMTIVPFERRKNEFLSVNEFYLKISPSLTKLIWGKKQDGKWIIKDIFNLPYLHRFDIFIYDDIEYLVCSTIARDKRDKTDWSRPGQIYVGKIPSDLDNENIVLTQICDGLYRNHGYSRGIYNNKPCGYFTCDSGIIRVYLENNEWKIDQIIDGKISEVALCDIDNDGIEEIMTIEPFHGNTINVYKLIADKYEIVYTYPNEIDFAHALISTTLKNKKCFIAGIRRINCELFILTYENNQFKYMIIENNVGPANLDVIHYNNKEYILSANHTKNEAAIYEVK